MADDENASLREFAGIIQEKAGPVNEDSRPAQPAKASEGITAPAESGGLQSVLGGQPRMVITGIAAGIGVAIGYLLGKLGRK